MKKLIAGNWKMNGNKEDALKLVGSIGAALFVEPELKKSCDILVCPPYLYLPVIKDLCTEQGVLMGAQDCSNHENGAFTGDIAADMITDFGAKYVILGHSERRQHHKESDEMISSKVSAAHKAGLIAIVCVGETEEDRERDKQDAIVKNQLKKALPDSVDQNNTVIAYEPVWAIGTGKTAKPSDVEKMHALVREQLKDQIDGGERIRLLYGGSMKPDNAKELLNTKNVDGGLIGGASLKAEDFIAIASAA